MNQLKALLYVEFASLFRFNHLKNGAKDKKARSEMLIKIIAYTILIVFCIAFGINVANVFESMGLENVLFTTLTIVLSILIFIITLFKQMVLFRRSDYDMLVSLPIKMSWIVFAKLIVYFVQSILISVIVYAPAGIVYGIQSEQDALYYVMLFVVATIAAVIPFAVAVIVGVVITYISSSVTINTNGSLTIAIRLISVLLCVVVVVIYEYFVLNAQKVIDVETISNTMDGFSKFIRNAIIVNDILYNHNYVQFLVYFIISIAIFAIVLKVSAFFFPRINTKFMQANAKGNYTIRSLKKSSLFAAVFKNEIKRYFSVSVYVMNTMILAAISLVLTIVFMFVSPEYFMQLLNTEQFTIRQLTDMIERLLPVLTIAMLCLVNTTSASISIESDTFWITTSLPIEQKIIYFSKLAVDLIVFLPIGFISAILFSIQFNIGILGVIALFLTPLSAVPFVGLIGLLMNIKYPKFDFQNPVEVVKQGMPLMVSMMIGMFVVAVVAVASILFSYIGVIIVDILLLIGCLVLWNTIQKINVNLIQ